MKDQGIQKYDFNSNVLVEIALFTPSLWFWYEKKKKELLSIFTNFFFFNQIKNS